MKKLSLFVVVAALAMLAVAAVPGIAFANAGPHGGYISNTEACAGCHRAHTAPSSITWTDGNNQVKSALLLSTASTLEQFCLTCHDTTGQGAGTNVVDGLYYGTTYGSNGASLISGPFGRFDPLSTVSTTQPVDGNNMIVTSSHITTGSWFAYGGGAFGSTSSVLATGGLNGGGQQIEMNCGTCHDPHGSSNYRILKDVVYGVAVGGYDGSVSATDPVPTPYVISNEVGFPVGGFRLHLPNTSIGYQPWYTSPQYAKAPTSTVYPGGDPSKGMTGWCVGCHTVYATKESTYNAADGYGLTNRHRHPMNVPLSNFAGPRSLIVTDLVLPLAHTIGEAHTAPNTLANQSSDWIDCMACHNAHGTTATMVGWANNATTNNQAANFGPNTGTGGVPPTGDSALLKLDNRGVCEACHNK